MLDETSIILALDELNRWQDRYDHLRQYLAYAPRSERYHRIDDLKRLEQQVIYYQDLIREMKREFNPPKAIQLMSVMNTH